MIVTKTEEQVRAEAEKEQQETEKTRLEVNGVYRCLNDGQNSIFWKMIVEAIDTKINLVSNLAGITKDNLDIKKGMVEAYKIVKGLPDVLKELTKE